MRHIPHILVALLLIPATAADHDGDPIPDDAEAVACGFPDVRLVLDLLGGAAGSCTGPPDFDHRHSAFTGEAVCDGDLCAQDVVLVQDLRTPAQDVEQQGPFPGQDVDAPVLFLHGYRADGQDYCIDAASAAGDPGPLCLDAGPAQAFVPVFQHEVLHVADDAVGPTPDQHVEATSVQVTVTLHWDESRLNDRVGFQGLRVWEPVDLDDPAAVQWWVGSASQTRADVRVEWTDASGDVLHRDTRTAPHAGQALAALLRTEPPSPTLVT